eukprot:Protomagalhaensia_sp_Gyna_25__216@NODE_10_length_9035_cov_36_916852_g6_i2_p3_GENE_NODE_10_length_9035_cov_36_916852_g6_i2NODE_10_length_9035_cov_36_916852_g6_i2_p3_ORF_typecomplete_len453_score60_25Zip/PF02535_22/1_8e04Zip/PF02535_22/2_7e30Zip/PF02535_22/1_8e04Zip/PF02535_22/6_5e02DUF3273/PF11677_8/0_02EXS/PF03124_14/0_47EXS/PF03124_14/5_8e02_NODE_10_length_9035_cov_36_916852_g6_i252376595
MRVCSLLLFVVRDVTSFETLGSIGSQNCLASEHQDFLFNHIDTSIHPPSQQEDPGFSINHSKEDHIQTHSHHDHHHTHHPASHSVHYTVPTVERILNTSLVLCFVVLVSVFGVSLPKLIQHGAKSHASEYRELIHSLCAAFAAGGFWGLALIHVFCEAVADLDSTGIGFTVGDNFMNAAYPLAVLGSFLMLMVEQLPSIHRNRRQARAALKAKNDTITEGTLERQRQLDAIIASLGLGFHSFFEGLIVGLREDPMLMWIAALSVAGHKWAEAFALAQQLDGKNIPTNFKRVVLASFVAITPVGILLGVTLTDFEGGPGVGIINAISAGVIMFVANHCTADVFGHDHHCHLEHNHEHSHKHSQKHDDQHHKHDGHHPHSQGASDPDHSCSSACQTPEELEPLHPKAVTKSELNASYMVFGARLGAMALGVTIVLAMMLVHLATPHTHAHGHRH